MSYQIKCLSVLVGAILCLAVATPARAQTSVYQALEKQRLLASGKIAYEKRCSGCHGMSGDGQGPGAVGLNPKPRDFTKGVFKFKTGPIGSLPSNTDLLATLNQGIPGTSMPSFRLVSDLEKLGIIEYIKSFAPEAWQTQKAASLPVLQMPDGVFTQKQDMLKYASRGRVWFQELGCVACHGAGGYGDGASSKTLVDVWGEPIVPHNLHKTYVKRGYTIQDIAKSIYYGVDGTPMPSHADVLNDLNDRFPEIRQKQYIWDLAAYVFYLRGVGAGIYTDELAPIPLTGVPQDEVQAVVGPYFQ